MFNQDNFLKAWLFASDKHKSQKYPGGDLPYLTHIGCVVMEVLAVEDSIEDIDLAVSCAILHDTIEDTEATYHEIIEAFSIDIADGVMALTKNNDLSTKEERMIDSLKRIKNQHESVWVVKLADRISNLGEPPHSWSQEKRQDYAKEAGMIVFYLGGANDLLSKRLNEKIENYQNQYCG